MPRRSVREVLTFSQPSRSHNNPSPQNDSPVVPETALEVRKQIHASLGMAPLVESPPTVIMEGHVCDFPLWSYSKKRSKEPGLRIDYEDGSFFKLDAPKGMPSPRFPGYLDVILYHGQRDLFVQETTTISVYRIFQSLRLDPGNGGNYKQFHRDMDRSFMMALITERFRNPTTGERSHVDYFRVMRRMRLAKSRQEESIFEFEPLFLQSLRAGYLKRLDFDFCLWLGSESKALARFFYGHLLKRIGEKGSYARKLPGFLRDCGLGYVADKAPKERSRELRETVFPALDLIKGKAIERYELDDQGNIIFLPSA
jgi:hypothetical protein